MSKTKTFAFTVLTVVSWLIFIGLCIEAGGLIVNFIFSLVRPEMISHLYQKLDLSAMYQSNQWVFFSVYSFILFISLLKVYLFYIVIRLLSKLDLDKPFSNFVSEQITRISYLTLSIGLLSYIARQVTNKLTHYGYEINQLDKFWVDSQAFILMAAVVYVIATIFKKGLEIQNENELTV